MATKETKEVATTVTVRECWLIHAALEERIKVLRGQGDYEQAAEVMKLSDDFETLWGDNVS